MKYRLTQGSHTRFEGGVARRYEAGEVFEASEAELSAFGDRLLAATIESGESLPAVGGNMPADLHSGDSTTATGPFILEPIEGIGPEIMQALQNAGIFNLEDLARVAAGPELAAIDGIGKSRATKIRKALMALEEKAQLVTEEKTQDGDGIVKEGSLAVVSETGDLVVNSSALEGPAEAQEVEP